MPSTTDTPDLTRRRTRRHRSSGRIDSYESLLLAGRKVDRRTAEAALFKSFEDRLHQELGGRSGLSAAQLALCRRAASSHDTPRRSTSSQGQPGPATVEAV